METLDHSWLERGNQDRVVGRSRGEASRLRRPRTIHRAPRNRGPGVSLLATARVGCVSPRPPDHRQTIAPLGPILLPLAMVLGLTGAATSAIQRSRRDTPDPRPSRDCYHNHAPLQPRTPSYVDAHGRLPVRDCRTRGPPSSYPTPLAGLWRP